MFAEFWKTGLKSEDFSRFSKDRKDLIPRMNKYERAVKVGELSGEQKEERRHQVFLDRANYMNYIEKLIGT